MTLEETVEYFGEMVESFGAYELCPCYEDDMEMAKIALSALLKQISKKPLPYKGYEGKCPTCGVIFLDRSTNYCGNCGQALWWG